MQGPINVECRKDMIRGVLAMAKKKKALEEHGLGTKWILIILVLMILIGAGFYLMMR